MVLVLDCTSGYASNLPKRLVLVKLYLETLSSITAGLKGFYESALERKTSIRKDFEAFYANQLKQKGFTFDTVENAGKQELAKEAKAKGKLARIGDYEQQLLEEARKSGWQGKAIPLDANQVEDQNMLAWTEKMPVGSEHSVLSMKIRPEGEKELRVIITKNVQAK